jgi:DNA anti-recombination protein RmuC
MASNMNSVKESTQAWVELMKNTERIRQLYEEEIGKLCRHVSELETEVKQSQEPKKWISENLEEAQQLIDNIVGIKGITEDPLKAASEAGIVYAEQPQQHVSISSSIVPSNEELYGY